MTLNALVAALWALPSGPVQREMLDLLDDIQCDERLTTDEQVVSKFDACVADLSPAANAAYLRFAHGD